MKYVALLLCCVACGGAPSSTLLEGMSTFEVDSDGGTAYVEPPLSQWADAGDEYALPGSCTSEEQGCGNLWCYYTEQGCGNPKQTPQPPNGGNQGGGPGPVPYR